ncbi:MAG: hypothetical protein VYE22_30695 [Myxococcota bacterium]|nr:hypothetical protein [Myxococcota bacterium]
MLTRRAEMGALALLAALAGCDATAPQPRCVTGADCASGVCQSDGLCAPPQDPPDARLPDGRVPPVDGGLRPDAGRDAGSGLCRPNEDGVVSRAEAPFGPGLMARYRTATDVGVDTAGADLGDGRRRWDFSDALPGDHDFDVVTEPLDGRWFADRYPGADYVAPLGDETDLLGVFRITETQLELMGVVSPTEGSGRTELTYEPPVKVLVFPLELGARWSTDARVTGVAQGLAANFGETYESEVDARGELVTPFAPLEALRVRTTLTRTIGFSRTVVRQFSFAVECFGTAATVVSEDDETEAEFDRAAEIRRLGF